MGTAVLEPATRAGKYGEGSTRKLADDRWQISYYDGEGRRRRESFSTEAKANRALNRAITLRDSGKLDPHEGRVKVDALAESYKLYAKNSAPKSYDWIELVWRVHLEPFFGGKLASRVTSDDIHRYVASRLEADAAAGTVNRELTVLRALFRQGAEADPPKIMRVPRFPEKLREANPRSGFVSDEQYAALQEKCKLGWLRALLAVAYNFGFRKAEMLGLRVSQVDLKARTIHLLTGETKSDKGRTVVMTTEVHRLLSEAIKDKKPGDAVFTWPNGRPVKDFRGSWDVLVAEAGMPDLLLHDFRRSAARNMIRSGISKNVAKRITGHSTDSIFDRYDITDESDLADAARKLEARNGHKMGTKASTESR
jgi:integrase